MATDGKGDFWSISGNVVFAEDIRLADALIHRDVHWGNLEPLVLQANTLPLGYTHPYDDEMVYRCVCWCGGVCRLRLWW